MIFYFSGCGNSRYIAEQISEALGEQLLFIPQLQREGFKEYAIAEDESVGFVFPIYSWAPPQLVEDFVLNTRWTGKARYVWFACTCGDEMGHTRRIFEKTLMKAGLHLDACYCFQMPETYLAFPGFNLDTPEGERRKISGAKGKLPQVIAQIKDCTPVWDEIIGSMPRIKSYLIRPGFVRNMSDSKYRVSDECIGCGKCEQVCPLHNISLDADKRPEWHHHCTQCMACYQHCPKNAIQIGKYTQGKGQYHFKTGR